MRDGRRIAYHEEGEGVPVIVFHGMGSSRYTWLGSKPLAEVCPGVRLIALDRPGYGNSSPPPFGYSYTEFARDVEEIADNLGIARFAVAGHSSGGPYALASAAVLGERVVAAAAVCSDGPYAHPLAPKALRASDDMSQPAAVSSHGLYGQEPRKLAQGMKDATIAHGVPAKVHAWKAGTDGWICDWALERLPWSFTVESIALGPRLTIWVGSEDIESIKHAAPFLHSLVPGSQLRVVQGGDHGLKRHPENLAAILGELRQHF